MMKKWVLLWTDTDGDAHCRLLEGEEEDADSALEILRKKYTDLEGFKAERIIEGFGFGSLSDIEAEYQEHLEFLAENEMDEEEADAEQGEEEGV